MQFLPIPAVPHTQKTKISCVVQLGVIYELRGRGTTDLLTKCHFTLTSPIPISELK